MTVTIGREFPAQVLVDDPRVSRTHLRVENVAGHWVGVDVSRNGVYLAGARQGSPVRSYQAGGPGVILTGLTTGRTEGCNRLVKTSNTAPAGSAAPSRPAHLKTPSAKQLRPARTAHESLKFKQYSASAT